MHFALAYFALRQFLSFELDEEILVASWKTLGGEGNDVEAARKKPEDRLYGMEVTMRENMTCR